MKQFGPLAAARILAAVAQSVAIILLARGISLEQFGWISAALGIQTAVLSLASFGVGPFIIREYATQNFEHVRAALRFNVLTTVAGSAIAVGIGLVVTLYSPAVAGAVAVLGVAVGLEKNVEARISVATAQAQILTPAVAIGGRPIAALGAMLALSPIVPAPLAYALGRAISALIAAIAIASVVRVPLSPERTALAPLLRLMAPLGLASAVGSLRSADTMLATATGGPAAGGLYAAASRVAQPILLATSAASSVLMRISATSTSTSVRATLRRLDMIVITGLAPVALVAVVGEPVMTGLLGATYSGSGTVLALIALGLPLTIGAQLYATVIQARRDEKWVLGNTVLFTIITLGAVACGAFYGGALGAAAGLALSNLGRAVRLRLRARHHAR